MGTSMQESSSKGVMTKILTLYLVTSGTFLLGFFLMLYVRQERVLIFETAEHLKSAPGAILVTLQDEGLDGLEELSEELDFHVALIDRQSGEILFSNLKTKPDFRKLLTPFNREKPGMPQVKDHFYLIRTIRKEQNRWILLPPPQFDDETRRPKYQGWRGGAHRGNRVQDTSRDEAKSQEARELLVPDFWRELEREDAKRSAWDFDLQAVDIVLEGDDIREDLLELKLKFLWLFLLSILGMGVVAYFLVRFSLRPLHEKIEMLNRFIKDSTHEINTPLSVIMMGVETMDREGLSEKNQKKVRHIELAAKSLAHLYEDLVYLNFPHTIPRKEELIAMERLIQERVDYFEPFAAKREMRWRLNLAPATLRANPHKIRLAIDNLLSNAIKYGKSGGNTSITLSSGCLVIRDEGEGMSSKQRRQIFERYMRFNKDQGGFGIGLSLVKEVCKEAGITLECSSTKGEGTAFTLRWE